MVFRLLAFPAAGLDQHRAGAPALHVVAERTRGVAVVVARQVLTNERRDGRSEQRGELLCTQERGRGRSGAVGRWREQRYGGRATRVADARAGILVVQV